MEKDDNGKWKTVLNAVDSGVVGPEYLRVDTVYNNKKDFLRRIFDLKNNTYWEYDTARKKDPCRMWPLEEIFWRAKTAADKKRLETREQIADSPPLTRHKQWQFFSGRCMDKQIISSKEMVFGLPSRKIRIGIYPGVVWDIWVSNDFPLPRRNVKIILLSLGLTPSSAELLLDNLKGGIPIDIEMFHFSGNWRMRYTFNNLPENSWAEELNDAIPVACIKKKITREKKFSNLSNILTCIDSGAKLDNEMTELGLCVYYCRALTKYTAHTAAKRFQTIKESLARRYLMRGALKKAPSQLLVPMEDMVLNAKIEVARDAAEVLTGFLPKDKAEKLVGKILLRGWREGGGKNLFLWATDLLRNMTGKDLGYWPGRNGVPVINKWIEILKKQN